MGHKFSVGRDCRTDRCSPVGQRLHCWWRRNNASLLDRVHYSVDPTRCGGQENQQSQDAGNPGKKRGGFVRSDLAEQGICGRKRLRFEPVENCRAAAAGLTSDAPAGVCMKNRCWLDSRNRDEQTVGVALQLTFQTVQVSSELRNSLVSLSAIFFECLLEDLVKLDRDVVRQKKFRSLWSKNQSDGVVT